ncbi:MAG: radical SAM protein [Elusimicrobiota bacterium]
MNSKKNKLVLFNVPSYYLEQQLGVPQLYGYLKKHGCNVVMKNLNYEFFNKIFTEKWLKRIYENRKNRKRVKKYFADKDPYSFINKVSEVNELMDKKFTKLGYAEFQKNYDILSEACKFISSAYYPSKVDLFFGIDMDYSPYSYGEIIRAADDNNENVLIEFYEEEVIGWLKEQKPDLVGISICHMNEFLPAFTLMKIIKKHFNVHIIIGGKSVTIMSRHLRNKPLFSRYFDFVGMDSGEYTLKELLEKLDSPDLWQTVPNLKFMRKSELVSSKARTPFDINDAETPIYHEPRPGAIIKLETSKKCYWGRCMFCGWSCMHESRHQVKKEQYQERDIELIDKDLRYIKGHYDPLYIRLSNSVITPGGLEKFIEVNKKYGFKFYAYIRADEKFASFEFCRKMQQGGLAAVAFGVESASDRLNKLYNKGVSIETIEQIIRNLTEAGIGVNLFCIINFPDETEEEMKKTVEYMKYLSEKYSCLLHMNNFTVAYDSGVWHKYRQFGITRIRKRPVGNYTYIDRYKRYRKLMIKTNPVRVWIRGAEDMNISYTCDTVIGKKITRKKDKYMLKTMDELVAWDVMRKNFLRLLKACSE